MTFEGPEGWERYSATLTVHEPLSPDEWRAAWKRFVNRLIHLGIPLIWRIELQRRLKARSRYRSADGVPHIHCVFWMPPDRELQGKVNRLFWEGWLECTGELEDADARNHAVRMGPCDDREFAAYLAAHTSKHKAEQLGWLGRQWGVVNAKLLREIKPIVYRFPVPGQKVWFFRLLEKHLRSLPPKRQRNGELRRKIRWKVSRTNDQARFLEPRIVERLVKASYRLAKSNPPRERPLKVENLSTGAVHVMK